MNVNLFLQQILCASKIKQKKSGHYTFLLNFLIIKLHDKWLVY